MLKNELAAGVLPCGRFGANAAWFRLAVISYPVLTALKRLALPHDLGTARPKRLRFLLLPTPGRLVRHARKLILKLACAGERIAQGLEAIRLLPLPACVTVLGPRPTNLWPSHARLTLSQSRRVPQPVGPAD